MKSVRAAARIMIPVNHVLELVSSKGDRSRPPCRSCRIALHAAAFLLIGTASLAAWMNGRYQIAFNASRSLDGTVFLVRLEAERPPAVGSLVAFSFDGSDWGFPAGVPWAKRIAGVAGETVEVRGQDVMVSGRVVGRINIQMMASAGLTPAVSGTIPAGSLFVIGDDVRSFDSRYSEFGLLPAAAVLGEAVQLL